MATDQGKTEFIENKDPNRPLSRYNKIRILLSNDGIPIQETWDPPEIAELTEDRWFKVTEEFAHRPDIISLIFYGTEQLYWAIAWVNKMVDPFAETYVGRVLRIPDRDNLFQTVLAK